MRALPLPWAPRPVPLRGTRTSSLPGAPPASRVPSRTARGQGSSAWAPLPPRLPGAATVTVTVTLTLPFQGSQCHPNFPLEKPRGVMAPSPTPSRTLTATLPGEKECHPVTGEPRPRKHRGSPSGPAPSQRPVPTLRQAPHFRARGHRLWNLTRDCTFSAERLRGAHGCWWVGTGVLRTETIPQPLSEEQKAATLDSWTPRPSSCPRITAKNAPFGA